MNHELRDPELETILGEPALAQLASRLHAEARRGPDPDPAFRSELRRRLMNEAWTRRQQRSWLRRLLSPPSLAWMGAALGVLLIAVMGFEALTNKPLGVQQVTVSSPASNAQTVALREAIPLDFTAPMDQSAVENSISVSPTVAVDFKWSSPTELQVVPVYPLAPQTHYQITVGSTAVSLSGQSLSAPATVGFTTAAPSPPPVPTPTPSASPPALPVPVKLGAVGTADPVWAQDSAQIYVIDPSGHLEQYPAGGGTPLDVASSSGVTAVAALASGPIWVRSGTLFVSGAQYPAPHQLLALGGHAGQVLVVTPSTVQTPQGQVLLNFAATATQAELSADGSLVGYLASDGLHVAPVLGGQDAGVAGATAFAFSPDSGSVAFATSSGVYSVGLATLRNLAQTPAPAPSPSASPAPVGTAPVSATTPPPGTLLAPLGKVQGLSWGADGRLLAVNPNGVYVLSATEPTVPVEVAGQGSSAATWSPSGGQFAYLSQGQAYTLRVGTLGQPSGAARDQLVNQFLAAREGGNPQAAMTYLDAAAEEDFPSIAVIDASLVRHTILLDQPTQVVARLVIQQQKVESAVLETYTFATTLGGTLQIDSATQGSPRVLGRGPEMVSLTVESGSVQAVFDSTLNQSTVAAGLSLTGIRAQVSYDVNTGVVTLTPAASLSPGQVYTLQVGSQLADIAGHPAAPLTISIVGPAS